MAHVLNIKNSTKAVPNVGFQSYYLFGERSSCIGSFVHIKTSEMNITGTLPQAGNVKLFVPSLSTQGSTRPKQNIFNVVLMRSDKTE